MRYNINLPSASAGKKLARAFHDYNNKHADLTEDYQIINGIRGDKL